MMEQPQNRIWEVIGMAISVVGVAALASIAYAFLWLQLSMTENMHRKFAGTAHAELLKKFERRGFDIASQRDGIWEHALGPNLTPHFFRKGKVSLKAACPNPNCRFHTATKSTPYLRWFQKRESAAWATRDGIVIKTFGEHIPMLGNL